MKYRTCSHASDLIPAATAAPRVLRGTLEKRTRTVTVCDGQLYMQGRIKDSNICRKEQITNFKFKLG